MELLLELDSSFPRLQPSGGHQVACSQRAQGYPERRFEQPYAPLSYTAPSVLVGPAWADPDSLEAARKADPQRNFAGSENPDPSRVSNPRGRTGLRGRGLLGRWGCNQAADPIVTRISATGILQMVAIERRDSGTWAIPGGMADAGERPSQTLARELTEEALGKGERDTDALEARLEHLFATQGELVYQGYVDDPRNTDDAWIETRAVHLHLQGEFSQLSLQAGDDAGQARWVDVDAQLLENLYANHADLVKKAVLDWQQRSQQRVGRDGRVVSL